jgi:hypothetical protein
MTTVVSYQSRQDSFEITITDHPTLRQKLRRAFNTRGKTGEELVAAIVKSGGVYAIKRKKNGLLNDGLNGEPAEERGDGTWNRYFTNGELTRTHSKDMNEIEIRYYAGEYNTQRIEAFHDNGQIKSIRRFSDHTIHDTPDGKAAIEGYDESGKLVKVGRANGTRHEAVLPHGVQKTEDGLVYQPGNMKIEENSLIHQVIELHREPVIKYLNEQEIAAYVTNFNIAQPAPTKNEAPQAKQSSIKKIVFRFKKGL